MDLLEPFGKTDEALRLVVLIKWTRNTFNPTKEEIVLRAKCFVVFIFLLLDHQWLRLEHQFVEKQFRRTVVIVAKPEMAILRNGNNCQPIGAGQINQGIVFCDCRAITRILHCLSTPRTMRPLYNSMGRSFEPACESFVKASRKQEEC